MTDFIPQNVSLLALMGGVVLAVACLSAIFVLLFIALIKEVHGSKDR